MLGENAIKRSLQQNKELGKNETRPQVKAWQKAWDERNKE
jgi:hypothetical protein